METFESGVVMSKLGTVKDTTVLLTICCFCCLSLGTLKETKVDIAY